MNAFPPGTRVFFWQSTGEVIYATVQSSTRLQDGTQMLTLKADDNRVMTIPAAGVTHVPPQQG
ncbi:hypothetical protein CC1G_05100 [Coprinopsis cinerea okayama7|uniref:Hypervirulence associated protein TUDOR domain-containing protein n=1 Tax=Coprinopsis cinerea (strain Okayama-7 / 130 / ATCC MYA-4618 / FGSC 9003) TaxID=240176 RepID=A8NGB9_COPC7|nr:hypothetical protein CC1G_05100 [Coprinopsis cinerea okayama7\|eukprot:XP_001833400.1 hypothetical protein CC1G_05100 [Coprinopsis cinerea okayama7\